MKYIVSIDWMTTAGNPATTTRRVTADSPEKALKCLSMHVERFKRHLKTNGGNAVLMPEKP